MTQNENSLHKQRELAQKVIKLTKVFHDEVGIPNGQLDLSKRTHTATRIQEVNEKAVVL